MVYIQLLLYNYTYEEPWRSINLTHSQPDAYVFVELAVRYFFPMRHTDHQYVSTNKEHNQEDLMSSLTNEHPQIIKMSRS